MDSVVQRFGTPALMLGARVRRKRFKEYVPVRVVVVPPKDTCNNHLAGYMVRFMEDALLRGGYSHIDLSMHYEWNGSEYRAWARRFYERVQASPRISMSLTAHPGDTLPVTLGLGEPLEFRPNPYDSVEVIVLTAAVHERAIRVAVYTALAAITFCEPHRLLLGDLPHPAWVIPVDRPDVIAKHSL